MLTFVLASIADLSSATVGFPSSWTVSGKRLLGLPERDWIVTETILASWCRLMEGPSLLRARGGLHALGLFGRWGRFPLFRAWALVMPLSPTRTPHSTLVSPSRFIMEAAAEANLAIQRKYS